MANLSQILALFYNGLGLDPKFYFKINVVLFLFPHVIGFLCIIGWLVGFEIS